MERVPDVSELCVFIKVKCLHRTFLPYRQPTLHAFLYHPMRKNIYFCVRIRSYHSLLTQFKKRGNIHSGKMLVHDQVNMYINIIDVKKILKTHILFIKFLKCSTPTFLTLSEHEEILNPFFENATNQTISQTSNTKRCIQPLQKP